jgi:hypothetical protein
LVVISPSPIVVEEGGPAANLTLTSTIPVLCAPQDRAFGECCIHLELAMDYKNGAQYCPAGNILNRVSLPNCLHKICSHNWNTTFTIPVHGNLDNLYNGEQSMVLDIKTGFTSNTLWRDYVLTSQQVKIVPPKVEQKCVSDHEITTFDGLAYKNEEEGAYTLYRHLHLPQEVQVYYRRCNLRELCHCAVSVRSGDIIITLDICSRGYIQIWGVTKDGEVIPESKIPNGFNILSISDGRAYEVKFSSGTVVSLGPYLSYIKILASPEDLGNTEGLCGTLDFNPNNELLTGDDGGAKCQQDETKKCENAMKKWMYVFNI